MTYLTYLLFVPPTVFFTSSSIFLISLVFPGVVMSLTCDNVNVVTWCFRLKNLVQIDMTVKVCFFNLLGQGRCVLPLACVVVWS